MFAEPAVVPEMTWKTQPTTGHVMGTVRTRDGTAFDHPRVDVYRHGDLAASRLTDGGGWFGFVDLEPGRYQIRLDGDAVHGRRVVNFTVSAGELEEVELTPKSR